MKNMIDVYELLKQFGTFIYTGNRIGDLELIEDEIKELYKSKMIEPTQFQSALLIIRHEVLKLKTGKM
jgi:uncharacterized protein YqgQ